MPDQVTEVHDAALEFVNNVYSEQMRARHFETPGENLDEHSSKIMALGRELIKEHVRHFLD